MINEIKADLLLQYGSEKTPSVNSIPYKLLLILLTGEKHTRPELEREIDGTVNNAITRLRGEYHWSVYFNDGYWWLDERHLPINGLVCSKANAKASAEAYVRYATKSKKQAEREARRIPKADINVQKAVKVKQEVNAE